MCVCCRYVLVVVVELSEREREREACEEDRDRRQGGWLRACLCGACLFEQTGEREGGLVCCPCMLCGFKGGGGGQGVRRRAKEEIERANGEDDTCALQPN
jgi:hypothetical protein